jgi:hypothetical protein
MVDISYGGYSFPYPLPFVGLQENEVFLSGQLDHSALSITLVGQLTGCDFKSLYDKRQTLEHSLSSGFQNLTIGSTGYNFAKPVGIEFGEFTSKSLPYTVSFEAFHEKDFSQFYGIESPVDRWSYQEQDGRTVSATHTVSARGLKTSDIDSLTAAKNFVNQRANSFENKSLFFSGDSVIKNSTSESIDRVNNSYSLVEQYSLSESLLGYDSGNYIVRPVCSISFSDGPLTASVNGTIKAGITGVINETHTGLFSPDQAASFARNSAKRSKTSYEELLYGDIFKKPASFSYDIDSGANNISFSFSFSDPTDLNTGEVLHKYSTDFSASKGDGFVTASINGTVIYDGINNIFTGSIPESEERYKKVDEYFSGIDQFSILNSHYSFFNDTQHSYSRGPLSDNFSSEKIDKSPFNSSISYNLQFSNKPDLTSGILKNAQLSVSTKHNIPTIVAQETLDNSFSVQDTYDTLKTVAVSLNGILNTGYTATDAETYFENFSSQYSGQKSIVSSHSVDTGSSNVAFSKNFTIINE